MNDSAATPAPPRMPLVIVGAGGHGRETLDVIEAIDRTGFASPWPHYRFAGFVADAVDATLLASRGATHLGPTGDLVAIIGSLGPQSRYHLAIGAGETRAHIDSMLRDTDPELADRAATLIHPLASVGSDARFAPGVYLAAGARVTTNVILGRHTHLNVNTAVSHDAEVGDYVTMSPGVMINGSVVVGDGVFFGTGAIVLPGRTIGDGAIIGAGAVVTTDVPSFVTATGVPARW